MLYLIWSVLLMSAGLFFILKLGKGGKKGANALYLEKKAAEEAAEKAKADKKKTNTELKLFVPKVPLE